MSFRHIRQRIKGDKESLDWGLDTTTSPVLGGSRWYGFHLSQDPPGSGDPARSRVCISR